MHSDKKRPLKMWIDGEIKCYFIYIEGGMKGGNKIWHKFCLNQDQML